MGGVWVKIEDKFLVAAGSTYTGTGGAASQSITLSVSNLPSHRHSFTPSGSVSSTFSGSSGTVSVSGANHKHTLYGFKNTGGDGSRAGLAGGYNTDANNAVSYSGDLTMSGSFTPSGSVSSSFTGSAGNTGYEGSGTAFTVNTVPPYQAVYIWERTA